MTTVSMAYPPWRVSTGASRRANGRRPYASRRQTSAELSPRGAREGLGLGPEEVMQDDLKTAFRKQAKRSLINLQQWSSPLKRTSVISKHHKN